METLYDVFPVILFILLSILLVALIILVFNLNKTLKKVDKIVDDVDDKVGKLDGAFNAVDKFTDIIANANDKVVSFLASGIKAFFRKKKKSKGEDDLDEE